MPKRELAEARANLSADGEASFWPHLHKERHGVSSGLSDEPCDMNLAIVGYGKMGRLVEQLAPEYGFAVPLRLDIDDNADGAGITAERFRGIDVAVEFSDAIGGGRRTSSGWPRSA